MHDTLAPLDVARFLKTNALARADIVLIAGTSLFSRAIRFATRSPFSHAALVFLIPDRDGGFERTFLIEAVPKGVSIRALSDILEGHGPKGGHDALAILRLDKPWFDEDLQKRVRGRLLDYIRAGYDWSTVISIAWTLLNGVVAGPGRYSETMRKSLERHRRKKRLMPANFICSGFVQYALLRSIVDRAEELGDRFPSGAAKEVIFDANLKNLTPEQILHGHGKALAELLATTPDEISRAANLRWKYVIKDRQVYEAANRAEAVAIVTGKPPK